MAEQEKKKRMLGFDLARSLAVFGMVLVNFKLVMAGMATSPSWLASFTGLFEGRAAATFVVLAGVGVSLMTARARRSGDPEAIRRSRRDIMARALFLLVAGFAYTPIWPADILHFYGIYMMIGAALLMAPARILWLVVAGLSVGFTVLLLPLDYFGDWNWSTLEYRGMWTPRGLVKHLFFNGFHPVMPWAGFLLAGMWLGRQNLRDPVRWRRILLVALGIVVLTELGSALLINVLGQGAAAQDLEVIQALFGTGIIPPMPLYMLSAGATAYVVILICFRVAESRPEHPLLQPLIATGQLALTLYIAHVLIGMGLMESFGLISNGTLSQAVLWTIGFCGSGVIFAWLWRRRFQRGPLEWAMRRVTG